MTTDDKTNVLAVQHLLDLYFRNILDLVEQHSGKLSARIAALGRRKIEEDEVESWLTPLINEVYEAMGEALYYTLPLLQPEDFQSPDHLLNFYFWPGYRTRNLDPAKRLYYVDCSGSAVFGSTSKGRCRALRSPTPAAGSRQ